MITSIILEWFNWSEHCAEDLSRTKITIYRNKNQIVYEEFDGRDNIIRQQKGKYYRGCNERLFGLLEEVNSEMTRQSDWSVAVCDGSCWKMKIRHSNNKLQKIQGTIELPPHGHRIEKEMMRMCEEAEISTPTLFGCIGVRFQATREFAEKWIDIFTRQPVEADFLFEEQMGNECFSLGFEMDCGHSFDRAYSKGRPLYEADELAAIIDEVEDIELLGSAIFSKWRGITHWSYESGFTDENKQWFLVALKRLKSLVTFNGALMYSDDWMNDATLRKSMPQDLTDESNIEYWLDQNNETVGVAINFEFADDVHYELTGENWRTFLKTVLNHNQPGNGLPKFRAFLKGKLPHIKFEEALKKNNIEFKKIAFFDCDFDD